MIRSFFTLVQGSEVVSSDPREHVQTSCQESPLVPRLPDAHCLTLKSLEGSY